MDVMSHKRFGCSDVYDKYLLQWNESGGFGAKNGQNLGESGGFWGGGGGGQNLDFSAELS